MTVVSGMLAPSAVAGMVAPATSRPAAARLTEMGNVRERASRTTAPALAAAGVAIASGIATAALEIAS